MKRMCWSVGLSGVLAVALTVAGCSSGVTGGGGDDGGGLTPARNLTGGWSGTGVFYQLDSEGVRVLKVTANCHMDLVQNGDQLVGTFDIYPTAQEPTGLGDWVPETEHHKAVNGLISGALFTFTQQGIGNMGGERWDFAFTTDLMQGHVTNLDTTYYLGLDSDPNLFHLTRDRD